MPLRSTTALTRSTSSSFSVAAVYGARKSSGAGVVFLQAAHLHFAFLQRANPVRARLCRAHRGHDRNFRRERGIANHHFVLTRNFPAWRVDDEINVAVLDAVEHVGPPFIQLVNLLYFDLRRGERVGRSRGRDDPKAEL